MRFRISRLLLLIPLILVTIYYFYLYSPEKSFINTEEFNLFIVGDSAEGGSTTVSGGLLNDGSYELTYLLGDIYDYPYANFVVNRIDNSFINFAKHDYIKVRLRSSSSKNLIFRIYIYIEDHTIIGNHPTYLPLIVKIPVDNIGRDYIIPIEDFNIPHWWFLNNQVVSRPDKLKYSFDSIIYFEIGNDDYKEIGVSDTVIIESITINKNIKKMILEISLMATVYLSILIVVYLLKNNFNKTKRTIKYSPLNLNLNNLQGNKIEDYIGLYYSNPLLNLTKISDDLGISIKNISDHINSRFNLSFPMYLNHIRITEAKNLLSATDIKILDIAISVGYNSAGHFNRTFKQMENCTPGEYRKKHSEQL